MSSSNPWEASGMDVSISSFSFTSSLFWSFSAGKKMQRVFSSVPLSNRIFSWEGTPSSMQMSFTTVERGIGLLGFWGGKKGVITWVCLSSCLNPNVSLFNDYSLINDYLSLKKYKFKMLTWKIVEASKALIIYIYRDR